MDLSPSEQALTAIDEHPEVSLHRQEIVSGPKFLSASEVVFNALCKFCQCRLRINEMVVNMLTCGLLSSPHSAW